MKDKELLDVYLAGAKLEDVLDEIVCAGIQFEGANVVLPKSRYKSLISRIKVESFNSTGLYNFLTMKTDRKFLKAFIDFCPEYISTSCQSVQMHYDANVRLLARLNQYDLLPEQQRKEFFALSEQQLDSWADITPFKDSEIAAILTSEELDKLKKIARDEMLPDFENRVFSWSSNFDQSTDPRAHFEELTDALDCFEELFDSDGEACEMITDARQTIESEIAELENYADDSEDEDWNENLRNGTGTSTEERSIFDDVDV